MTIILPKPLTSNAKAQGRYGKQDFRYLEDGSFDQAWQTGVLVHMPVVDEV